MVRVSLKEKKRQENQVCAHPEQKPSCVVKAQTEARGSVFLDHRDNMKTAPWCPLRLRMYTQSPKTQEHMFYKGESQHTNFPVSTTNTIWETDPIN